MKKNKKILIVVGGGIAAYKTLDLIRILKKKGYSIKTVLTKSGKEFVTSLSLTTISGDQPYENLFDANREAKIDHITLSRWADLIIVVPTTANFMNKLSTGKADDLASTLILASNKDTLLAPAMNVRMWKHQATINNYKLLQSYGYLFIGPENGEMACGEYGEGKMSSPDQIYQEIERYFDNKDLLKSKKLKALVTTGPTREYLDPVRFISNESSGKQGYEIAKSLAKAGIKTTLVSGVVDLNPVSGLKIIKVITAKEMFDAVKKILPVDIAVCTAAVSDFRPKFFSKNKLKKNEKLLKFIELEKNQDILEFLGKNNRFRPKILVGFSAETNNLFKNSLEKLKQKHCDLIVANKVGDKTTGFNKDFNKVTIIDSNGKFKKIKKNHKSYIASILSGLIFSKFLNNDKNLN